MLSALIPSPPRPAARRRPGGEGREAATGQMTVGWAMKLLLHVMATAILMAMPFTDASARATPQDRAVLAAHEAFQQGDRARLGRQAEKTRGHVLESYVSFWRLRLRIEEAAPAELRDFLAQNDGTVIAERLRREWLPVLGQKGEWETFRQVYPGLVKTDPEVACYALQDRWRLRDAEVPAETRSFLQAPQPLPAGCAPLIDALLLSGDLTPKDLRDRVRLLVQTGFVIEARRTAERMPADQALSPALVEKAAGSPALFLEDADEELKTAAGRELAIVALKRLARTDPRAAAKFWEGGLRERFSPEDQRYGWAVIATGGAKLHLPEALDWFRKAGDLPLSDEQGAWRTRMALRQEDWTEVRQSIERMSPSARNEPAWIYWLGRSQIALGAADSGHALWERISGEHHYYGRLAAEEMGIPLRIPERAEKPTPDEQAAVRARPGLQRAIALYRIGLRNEAKAEWLWAIRGMNDRALLAAAELAKANGIWDRAINTAERTVAEHDFTMRYLAPYGRVLSKEAAERRLEEPLVLGLVRQESRFVADARSSAGASGLMQLMPATARQVAKKLGMKGFSLSHLEKPEVNAALGSQYLRHVLDGFGGCPVLATAAYNAGPSRARRWLDERPLEGAIYVESIPFAETRLYVQKVLANAVYYAALAGGAEQRSLKSRLGRIEAAAAFRKGAGE